MSEQIEKKNEEQLEVLDWRKELWEWLEAVAVSFVVLVFIFVFIFRIVGVSGVSMKETLHDGDRIIVFSLFYQPSAGDIVVVNQPEGYDKPIIKRIIATEGQEVDIDFKTGEVYIDDELQSESYISSPTMQPEGVNFPITVPEGCVFVMGDNRMESLDSRSEQIGMIDTRYIIGRAVFRIFPFNQLGLIE